jgi:hypothetical protein
MDRRKFLAGSAAAAALVLVPADALRRVVDVAPRLADANDFQSFQAMLLRKVADAMAMPYEALIADFNAASYSACRARVAELAA